jgi:hypothetical protein
LASALSGFSHSAGHHSDLLPAADCELIERKLPAIVGWLASDTAYLTAYLMNFQSTHGIGGPALEFGVYHGKYLLLLLHCALKHGEWVGGYDTFHLSAPETPWRHAAALFGSHDRMALWKADSRTLTNDAVLLQIGVPPRFVSVDGDHSAEGTLHDLRVASEVMADDGIIALDDMFNAIAMGAAEGSFRFLGSPGCKVVPFAYVDNKTLLCNRDHHRFYFDAARSILDNCPDLALVRAFRRNEAGSRVELVQKLAGVDVILFLQDLDEPA